VSKHNAKIKNISDLKDAKEAIENLGCDPGSIPIMAPKMIHRIIELENIHLQDAIIIKQDMLSIGGEVAVPKHTFQLNGAPTSILICGTLQQHLTLVDKLKRHYQRLKNVSQELDKLILSIL